MLLATIPVRPNGEQPRRPRTARLIMSPPDRLNQLQVSCPILERIKLGSDRKHKVNLHCTQRFVKDADSSMFALVVASSSNLDEPKFTIYGISVSKCAQLSTCTIPDVVVSFWDTIDPRTGIKQRAQSGTGIAASWSMMTPISDSSNPGTDPSRDEIWAESTSLRHLLESILSTRIEVFWQERAYSW